MAVVPLTRVQTSFVRAVGSVGSFCFATFSQCQSFKICFRPFYDFKILAIVGKLRLAGLALGFGVLLGMKVPLCRSQI